MNSQAVQTLFIRHNIDSTPQVLEQLWERRCIALHYGDNSSTDPADYEAAAAKRSLKRLKKCCDSGAIVGADFRRIRKTSMLVGEIPAQSQLRAEEYIASGRSFTYKVVQLQNAREVSYVAHPVLSAIQPRQTAITGWPSAQTHLLAALGRIDRPRGVRSLHPSQLEVACYEYLRMRGELTALLMPIGGQLLNVDIVGLSPKGSRLLAQVTHQRNIVAVKDKMNALRGDITGARLVFFGPEECRNECAEEDNGIDYVSIEAVFEALLKVPGSPQSQMLEAMLG